jgi:hypothetical protein
MVQGINENVSHRGRVFHIQTEDKGKNNPTLVSTLFYHGMILAEERLSYKDIIDSESPHKLINELLNELHGKMVTNLTEGIHDKKIDSLISSDDGISEQSFQPDESSEAVDTFEKAMLLSLERELNIQLSDNEKQLIEEKLPLLRKEKAKERFLSLCSEVYELIQDRCDQDSYKKFLRNWLSGLSDDYLKESEPPVEQRSNKVSMIEIVERITLPDLTAVIGNSLAHALIEKLFREIHDVFLKKSDAFSILCERIVNSGIVVKRTSPEWRKEKMDFWMKQYEVQLKSSTLHV